MLRSILLPGKLIIPANALAALATLVAAPIAPAQQTDAVTTHAATCPAAGPSSPAQGECTDGAGKREGTTSRRRVVCPAHYEVLLDLCLEPRTGDIVLGSVAETRS